MERQYNFEYEGSCTTTKRIYEQLEKQYQDMLSYADKYNLIIDESLDKFDKFLEFFDEEYYNCGNFNRFQIPYADYTLYVDNIISTDTVVFLPSKLANKFNPLEISQHFHYATNTYFDALISNYLENYYLLKDIFEEDILLDIEAWITENGKGRKITKDYAKATQEKLEKEIAERNKKNNLVKGLRQNLHDFGSVLSDEDYEAIENIIDRYK